MLFNECLNNCDDLIRFMKEVVDLHPEYYYRTIEFEGDDCIVELTVPEIDRTPIQHGMHSFIVGKNSPDNAFILYAFKKLSSFKPIPGIQLPASVRQELIYTLLGLW